MLQTVIPDISGTLTCCSSVICSDLSVQWLSSEWPYSLPSAVERAACSPFQTPTPTCGTCRCTSKGERMMRFILIAIFALQVLSASLCTAQKSFFSQWEDRVRKTSAQQPGWAV